MRSIIAAALVISCGAIAPSLADTLKAPHPAHKAQVQTPAAEVSAPDNDRSWIDAVTGHRFSAVDGSTATLTDSDDGLTFDTVSPDGTQHALSFIFLGDNLGSIYEGDDHTHVMGVFRQSGGAIEADFADGRSETLAPNSGGGLTLFASGPDSKSYCLKWFPEGHAFGDADMKAALAEYANRLGLAQSVKAAPVSRATCIEAWHGAPAAAPVLSASPAHALTASGAHPVQASLVQPISVRTSDVHLIDPPAALPQSAAAPALATPAVAHEPPPAMAAAQPAPQEQNHGASSCLKIDTDGSSWGFHNNCGYPVQFAWCLQNGNDRATACGSGTGSGHLDSNGFAALMPGNAVVDADNQFRWVACTGGSQVSAQLDRSDPPAGRCIVTGDQ
jgi:hypothetical protein